MRLNLRQAITSGLVGFAAAAAVVLGIHGAVGRSGMETIAMMAIAVGASRLVETRR